MVARNFQRGIHNCCCEPAAAGMRMKQGIVSGLSDEQRQRNGSTLGSRVRFNAHLGAIPTLMIESLIFAPPGLGLREKSL